MRNSPSPTCSGDTEEESEGEELRKAAKAYTAANKQAKSQPEIIVLDDSSDDEPRRPQPAAHRLPPQLSQHVSSPHSQSSSRQQHSSQPSSGQSAGNQSPATLPGSRAQGSSRQLPTSFQSKPSSSSGLRIKLHTNAARHHQQQQQQQQSASQGAAHMTNGHTHASLHPADPASSAARLAAAAASLRPPVARQGAGPSNLGTKRKHYELDGQYGPYSQASAQAAGMSMSDHIKQAANRGSGSRLLPYPETTISYGSRSSGSGSYSQPPHLPGGQASQLPSQNSYQPPNSCPSGWQHQQPPGASAYAPSLGSPAYASGMPASPTCGSLSGNLQSHQAEGAARNAGGYVHMAQYGSDAQQWNEPPLADGEL